MSSDVSPPAQTRPGDPRLEQALAWLRDTLPHAPAGATPVSGDASFRRYFRVSVDGGTAVLMDAPPDREDVRPFLDVTRRLLDAGVDAPQVLAADADHGFLLLEDFGDELLRGLLDTNNADQWFARLFGVLERFVGAVDSGGLPPYDRDELVRELELFTNWYLERHLGRTLSCEDWDVWEDLCTRLVASAAEQPAVFVHKDFHSCNLLVTPDERIGVIDYQDALRGPLTYDLVSLLWDRYIRWPRSRLEGWMEDFRQRIAADVSVSPDTWVRWCDWMGLQRNLKIVGIFARLHYRDGKAGYLEMIPRFYAYLVDVLPRYREFAAFADLLERLKCAP